MRGFVAKVGQTVKETAISAIGKIYPSTYIKYTPRLTCACCGSTFLYRGIKDADSIAGLTYSFETEEWVATQSKPVLCDECEKICKGGTLDGMTIAEAMGYDRESSETESS